MRKERRPESGQAITEFVIAIVGFIVIIAGMIQIGELCRAKVQTMIGSRATAGVLAINNTYSAMPYPFVATWADGPDRLSYTEDDVIVPGDGGDFMSVAVRATSYPINYPFYTPPYVHCNALAAFMNFNYGDYRTTRGWAVGDDYRDVPIDPAVQRLIFARNSLTIKSSTFLPPFGRSPAP